MMYRIPKDLNLENIIGRDLNLLGLGKHDIQLNFDGSGIKICVQGAIRLIEDGKVIATWTEHSWSSIDFQKILNATVESYAVPRENLLEIRFEDELTLQLHDDSDQYETMQIYFDDKTRTTIII
jgi:hypothetical protein